MAGRGRILLRLQNNTHDLPIQQDKEVSGSTGVRLLAKYSYKANPENPGGFREIDIKQGENVWLVKKGYESNNHWWRIEKDDGTQGYAPAQYLMEINTKLTSLPWLNSKSEPASSQENSTCGPVKFKRYVATYSENKTEQDEKADDFYCKICEREFNGPIPYRAHINSKAHKEEVEVARQYGRQ